VTKARSHTTSRGVRVAIVVATIAVVGAACKPAPPAVSNGRLPDSMLATLSPECRIANDLAGPLSAMMIHAHMAGVALAPERSSYLPPGVAGPPQLTSCYRSYDMQVWWRNYYCSIGACNMAAPPGTSKHGWGRAIDFEDQLGELTWFSPGYAWLVANAAAFGFYQPASNGPFGSSPEAWHWVHD
jgi:hypothetical protein